MENYICVKLDKHLIFNLAKLRISNHQLEVETGRCKKRVINQRLCKVYNENGCVEDEFHFFMTCKAYQTERNEFFTKLNAFIVPFESYTSQEQFLFLMSTNDTEVIILKYACRFASPQGDNQDVHVFKSYQRHIDYIS